MNIFNRLRSISTKAIVAVLAMIILCIAASSFYILNYFSGILGTDRLRQNISAAEIILNPGRAPYTIRDGALYAGEHKLNGDFSAVDEIASAFGGVSTLFQDGVRISTSVRKKDGTRAIGTKIDPKVALVTITKKQTYIGEAMVIGRPFLTVYKPLLDPRGKVVGVFAVAFEKSVFNKTFTDAAIRVTIAGLILALICGSIGAWLFHRLFAPFGPLSEKMADAQNGRYSEDVPYTERKDEFGHLAEVILAFNRNMIHQEKSRKAAEAAKIAAAEEQKRAEDEARRQSEQVVVRTFGEGIRALAEDDLTFRLGDEVPDAYLELKDNFNAAIAKFEGNRQEREEAARLREADRIEAARAQMEAEEKARLRSVDLVVASFGEGLAALARRHLAYRLKHDMPEEYKILQDDFNNAISQLEEAMIDIDTQATDIANSAADISRAAQEMAGRTERQAASLEETAAAVNEITSNVTKSAENANAASDKAQDARGNAERGNEVAIRAVEAMRRIAKSSNEIAGIIGVIDEIAFQTNLLALNAGVEAARAGEAGRGFAVVAQEVRALAGRSAEAARQIKGLIKTSDEEVSGGVKLVEESGAALVTIVTDIASISDLVTKIAESQKEQAHALREIDTAVSQMDQSTQQNAAMAEESHAAADAMAGFAHELATLVAHFETSRRLLPHSVSGRDAA